MKYRIIRCNKPRQQRKALKILAFKHTARAGEMAYLVRSLPCKCEDQNLNLRTHGAIQRAVRFTCDASARVPEATERLCSLERQSNLIAELQVSERSCLKEGWKCLKNDTRGSPLASVYMQIHPHPPPPTCICTDRHRHAPALSNTTTWTNIKRNSKVKLKL